MAFTLPTFLVEETDIDTGIALPLLILDGTPVSSGLILPTLYMTETGPETIIISVSGGVKVGGGADIVEEVFVVSGGVEVSGEAFVDSKSVTKLEVYPTGGVRLTGTATLITRNPVFKASGGARASGVATVETLSLLYYVHIPSLGVAVSGAAKDPLHVAKGGVVLGGSGNSSSTSVSIIAVTGGVRAAGQAVLATALIYKVRGGVSVFGASTVSTKSPRHVPSGGVAAAGRAVSIFLASDRVLTPENPFGDVYDGWAMNYDTGAASRYEDLPINSMCTVRGRVLVATEAGIYELGSDTDAGQPIRSMITIAKSDLGERANKRVPYVYLGYQSDNNLRVSVLTNKHSVSYYDTEKPSTGNRGSRAVLGRGIDGLYWSFRIDNVDGAFFELDTLKIEPTILRKMGV